MQKKWAGLLGVAFLILALAVTLWQLPQRQSVGKKAAGESASLTLPSKITVNPGDQFDVPIFVDTDGASISGLDVVLDFSAALDTLSLVAIESTASSTTSLRTFAPVDANGVFDTAKVITKANTTGKVEFGAVVFDWSAQNLTKTFSGVLGPSNPLAVLTFQVADSAAAGQVTLRVVHTPGETNDSNLVEATSVTDILARANAMTIKITLPVTPAPSFSSTPTLTPLPTPTLIPTEAPKVHCQPLGDLDCSGLVNSIDFSYAIAVYNTTDPKADLDDSGQVNAIDVSIILANFNKTNP